MGAAKDLWMDEVEQVGEDYRTEKLTHDDAMKKMQRLGFDASEASDMLAEGIA